MQKVFLSHSSSDKARYVSHVAQALGKQRIEFDEETFEEGAKTDDEIAEAIDSCTLFALFISDAALSSKWVLAEISRARTNLQEGTLKRVYPIIIDPAITHDDPRIPEWLRNEYNLKLVNRPSIAARRIQNKIREIQWQQHPIHEERKRIFVGRNSLLQEFESRIDNIDFKTPTCIIASGISKIGRSKFLHHALAKANLVDRSFEPVKILIERVDSVEDFIIKLFKTGLTSGNGESVLGLLDKSTPDKIKILTGMLNDLQAAKEVVFVEDHGTIVDHMRVIAPWLIEAIEAMPATSRPVLCVAAKYRVDYGAIRRLPHFYSLEVPELNPSERSGLLKRILEVQDIEISGDDFKFFSMQLRGYPEEAYFCADLLADLGIRGARNESHLITEFNREKASVLLKQYEQNQNTLDFIYLLSEFEFVSLTFLFEIVEEEEYASLLNELITKLICDYVDNEREFVRINDTIRDLIRRNRLEIPIHFAQRLREHVKSFIKDTDKFERDTSDYFYSIKEGLIREDKIDDKFIAPSHVLRTIKDLYQRRENLKRVVSLADMLLLRESSLQIKLVQDVRYYLCLSLARQKDRRVLTEAQKIAGPEHHFVLGYYYRLVGRHADAISKLTGLLETPYIASRAKRELVQVYLYIEEFDKALEMARENYEANRGNQFPIQSYLHCLLNSDDAKRSEKVISDLIDELDQIGSSQSRQMTLIAKAHYESKFSDNQQGAYNLLDDAESLDDKSPYPHFARFDIALRSGDTATMNSTLVTLEAISKIKTFSKNTMTKNRAFYEAASGRPAEAHDLIKTSLTDYPRETLDTLHRKIDSIAAASRPD